MKTFSNYRGITHDICEQDLDSWKEEYCPQEIHCFDEVENSCGDWYLICDACGLMVHILKIEEEDE